jgi:peptide/nickel transport system permease protein
VLNKMSGPTGGEALAVAKRLVSAVVLLLGITCLVFLIAQAAPGDPASAMLGAQATPARVATLRRELGLDRSVVAQYGTYLRDLLGGDLGHSYYGSQSVAGIIGRRLPVTMWLVFAALIVATTVSISMALLSAARRGTWVDHTLRGATIAAVAMPSFWVGLLLVLLIALPTGIFPVGGFGDSFGEHLRSIVLPAVTLALALVPAQVRILRGGLIEALDSDYVAAARSRGVGACRVLARHALPNAVWPTITIISIQAGYLLFGAVVIENTFQLPGLGSAMVTAVGQRDYPVITGITLIFAVLVVAFSTVSDLLQVSVNPRKRHA